MNEFGVAYNWFVFKNVLAYITQMSFTLNKVVQKSRLLRTTAFKSCLVLFFKFINLNYVLVSWLIILSISKLIKQFKKVTMGESINN